MSEVWHMSASAVARLVRTRAAVNSVYAHVSSSTSLRLIRRVDFRSPVGLPFRFVSSLELASYSMVSPSCPGALTHSSQSCTRWACLHHI